MSNEEWRPVVGYEGLYEISSLGRMKTLPRPKRGFRSVYITRERLMKPSVGSSGYLGTIIQKNGKNRTIRIHRLVARAFLGPSNGMDVDHVNGDKTDNRLENLRYVTHRQNLENWSRLNGKDAGVYYQKETGRWRVHVSVSGKSTYVGTFDSKDEAKSMRVDFLSSMNERGQKNIREFSNER